MVAKVGSLVADFGMNTGRYEAGIKKVKTLTGRFVSTTKKQFRAIRGSINTLGSSFLRLGSIIAAIAGPAAMIALTKRSMALIDTQVKLADTLGISQKALAGFELAGQMSGATVEQVRKSLEKLAVNVAEAAGGTGIAKDAIEKLNLSAAALMDLPLDEQFKIIADRLSKVKNATEKAGIAYDIFGRQGISLIKTLDLGREGLDAFIKKSESLGLSLSRIDSAKIEQANDAILAAKETATGLGNIIAVEVSPIIAQLANDYTDASVAAKGHRDVVRNMIENIIKGVGFVADTINGVSIAWKTAEVAVRGYVAGVMLAGTLGSRGINELINAFTTDDIKFENTAVGRFVGLYTKAFSDAKAELDALLAKPPPSEGLFEWVEMAKKKAEELAETTKKAIEEISVTGKAGPWAKLYGEVDKLGLKFTNVFDSWDQGVKGMRETFKNNLRKMVMDLMKSEITKMFFSDAGGFFAGGAGGLFRKLLGFSSGGSFDVKGQGGTDSNLVAFRATKGERVTVTKPGQHAGGGGVVMHNSYDFSGRGALDIAKIKQDLDRRDAMLKAEIIDLSRRGRFA